VHLVIVESTIALPEDDLICAIHVLICTV